MAPQLYLTVYNEQFASPGKVKRVQLRPHSAHRRNNPQPQPDFLFPRNLKSGFKYPLHPSLLRPPVDTRGPLFPPVRHLSFHGPVRTGPAADGTGADPDRPQSSVEALPSVGGNKKLQFSEPPAARIENLSRFLPQQIRQKDAEHRLTSNTVKHHVMSPHRSGCYSCFHVVNRYQAGHYTIHPEFVSELSP